jgi:hypothetical protein
MFANEEYPQMDFMFGFCNGNGRVVVAEYQQQYPFHTVSHYRTFEKIIQNSEGDLLLATKCT